uniref:Uncharacterized protein n=1 Tax=Timema tahoe TaxID=61484 RepID=A0A7R9NZ25_9NEOP|nr:unnamed protein product [Timema tahoe]
MKTKEASGGPVLRTRTNGLYGGNEMDRGNSPSLYVKRIGHMELTRHAHVAGYTPLQRESVGLFIFITRTSENSDKGVSLILSALQTLDTQVPNLSARFFNVSTLVDWKRNKGRYLHNFLLTILFLLVFRFDCFFRCWLGDHILLLWRGGDYAAVQHYLLSSLRFPRVGAQFPLECRSCRLLYTVISLGDVANVVFFKSFFILGTS